MKKLLVLMMVLGLASMANAALEISVNGDYGVTEVGPLLPSDILILDIRTIDPIAYLTVDYYALVAGPAPTGMGTIDLLSGITTIPDTGTFIEHSAPASAYITGLMPGEEGFGINLAITDMTAGVPALSQLFDEILFHCDGPGDVMITLYLLDGNFAVVAAQDSVLVHQIPEPITMALLGLGGLFLRRRK